MEWYDEQGAMLGFTWLCAFCVEELAGFDPDMGDPVDWKPGTCERCKKELTVFTPTESNGNDYHAEYWDELQKELV